ncbi:Kinesin light chain, partial [Fusarium oxysporum f. sp. albedinis]
MMKARICQAVWRVFAAYPEPAGRQGLVSEPQLSPVKFFPWHHFICLIYDFFSPRHSGLCAPRLPLLDRRSLQSRTAQRPCSSLRPRLLPGTPPGFDNLSHWLRPLDQTVGSKRYRAYLETGGGG